MILCATSFGKLGDPQKWGTVRREVSKERGQLTDASADFLQQEYCFAFPRGARNGGVIVTNVNKQAT